MTIDLLGVALRYQAAGCSVVPVASDGGKLPAVAWTGYQTTAPTPEQLRRWFTAGQYDGLGLICGAVSGQLEMLEVEGRAADLVARLAALMADHGLADLWTRLVAGHAEITPSGGMHWLYRVDGAARRNLKLARRPSTPDELAGWQASEIAKAHTNLAGDDLARRLERIDAMTCERLPQVLIETRGEGGFTVLAPSGGRTHPSGKPWLLIAGGIEQVPTLTEAERDALHAVAGMLDQMPAEQPAESHAPRSAAPTDGSVRPGDDFNARADWSQILIPHGWTEGKPLGRTRTWIRPGKDRGDGISATTGRNGGDNLYVFSSSTEFDTETAYSKFAAYTLLEHGGDWTAAAKQLRSDGYGAPLAQLSAAPVTPPPTLAVALGTSALAPDRQNDTDSRPALALVAEPELITTDAGLTDVGNAELLVQRHGHELRYVPERGAWLRWGGTHWSWDESGRVVEAAKATVLAIPAEPEALSKHRTRSLSRRSIEAMVALARTHPQMTAPAALLDSDPYALCTPSGVVNLTTGHVEPARPEDLHTRSTTVPCKPMPTPRWDGFLRDTFAGDDEMLGFVQRLAGYSCTGVVTHHVLPFLHGKGGNGKSVFLDVMRRLLGDYAASAPAGFLLAGQQQHDTEIARLAGLRFVICSEVNQESRFDEAKVKLLTGGDALTARFMRQDHFTFTPSHHLWLMGNHQPRISAGGDSFERRLRLIPFTQTIPDNKKIDGLDRLLVDDEGPGILAWVVEGARQALSGGLRTPESVKAATRVYMAEEDALARFVEDRCLLGGGRNVRTDTAQVRTAYTAWCNEEGEKAVSPQVFGRELRTRYGIEQSRSHGKRFYDGLSLLVDEDTTDHWANQ
jgi:putative DNA primase/helicase